MSHFSLASIAVVILTTYVSGGVTEPTPRTGPNDPTERSPVTFTEEELLDIVTEAQPRDGGHVLLVECTGSHGYTGIQEAMDAAEDGDVVVVLPNYCSPNGRYCESIRFPQKSITVRSADPLNEYVVDNTIIDGGGARQTVTMFYLDDIEVVLSGLTITNGHGEQGGGIFCEYSNPIIEHCKIVNNASELSIANSGGAGIFLYESDHTIIRDCTFSGNVATGGPGSAILSMASSPIIQRCRIIGNWSSPGSKGGAIHIHRGDLTRIIDCTIMNNESPNGDNASAGISGKNANIAITECLIANHAENSGIHLRECDVAISDCRIKNNDTLGYGGGVNVGASSLLIENTLFRNNFAAASGGALTGICSDITLLNCILTENTANALGGALNFTLSCTGTVTNCTIVSNTANDQDHNGELPGGGVHSWNSFVSLTNCILWDNLPNQLSYSIEPLTVNFCDVQDGWPGEGNIDAAPGFGDSYNLRLAGDSPCINAGDPLFVFEPNDVDIDNEARVANCRIDLGADEFVQPISTPETSTATANLTRKISAYSSRQCSNTKPDSHASPTCRATDVSMA